MTESELRSKIRASEEAGFRELFQQYQAYVYAIVWSRIKTVCTKEDAEECVSDIFAEIFMHFGDIREGSLQGYIGTLAKRRAIDMFRKHTSKADTYSLSDDNMPEIASDDNVEEQCESASISQVLLEKIRSLGEPDATILIQKFYYDRKSEEIAAAVKLQPVAVRVRMSRALKRLRKLLDADGISM